MGAGGKRARGGNQVPPENPGLPLRGRVPIDASPCQIAMGEEGR